MTPPSPSRIHPHPDIHSHSNPDQIRVRHLELDLDVSFERRALSGTATLLLERIDPSATVLGLDGQDVVIRDTSIGNADIKFPFRAVANAKLVLTELRKGG